MAIPPNETLVVDAGARIHFHAESGLIIANNASLHVEGGYSSTEDLENEVIFGRRSLRTRFFLKFHTNGERFGLLREAQIT
ncbi:MAG: hypothetical protein R2790_09715 [Flavobacterium haoranii]